MIEYSKESPCRCGYDGIEIHYCHAINKLNNERCKNEAQPFFSTKVSSLAGMQIKFSANIVCYCHEHIIEAGF